MIKKLTMWLTTDGNLHEERKYAKARQKRLDEIRAINEKIQAGEMLGPLFRTIFGPGYDILNNVNTDTPIMISCYPQYKHHVEELLDDGRVVLRLENFNKDTVIMGKTQLCFYLRHPVNQPS